MIALNDVGIRIPTLVLGCLILVLASRWLAYAALPETTNFLHFPLVFLLFVLAIKKIRSSASFKLLVMLSVFLAVSIFSAVINAAGAINVVLFFLLLLEAALLVFAMTIIPWDRISTDGLHRWVLFFLVLNALISLAQFSTGLRGDQVTGLFVDSGAGAHIAGAVGLCGGIYLFATLRGSLLLRIGLAVLSASVVILADAKQVIFVFAVALGILALTKIDLRNTSASTRRLLVFALMGLLLFLVVKIAIPAANAPLWHVMNGLEQKMSVVPLIASYHQDVSNTLFGLGPGHTVSRLGLLAPKFSSVLSPLGLTTAGVTEAVWASHVGNHLSNPITGSTLFSLLFTWSGVWGDLGIVGLFVYSGIWILIYRHFCRDDLARFLVIATLVFGAVFDWMEEPGYMLVVAVLIGLRWQDGQSIQNAQAPPIPAGGVSSANSFSKL